jgi:hypothetical protein
MNIPDKIFPNYIKCAICGKFMSYMKPGSDCENGISFIPPSWNFPVATEPNEPEWVHNDCWRRGRAK